jgi:Arc/MetJ-type ribon-helix-helix transcriptional regulator
MGMKLSISLPDGDVEIIDAYAREAGLESRSAAIQHAVRLLSGRRLADDYSAAWEEWDASGEADMWDRASGDGLSDASR